MVMVDREGRRDELLGQPIERLTAIDLP